MPATRASTLTDFDTAQRERENTAPADICDRVYKTPLTGRIRRRRRDMTGEKE
ncbi:hypothetical protein FORC82_p369 (plasmid) [Escherichia coli]|nr:hypothetical protein FORC82_p369 [Escherichia coli]